MRIQINDGENHNIKILLPSSLIFSDLTAIIACKFINKTYISDGDNAILDSQTKAMIKSSLRGAFKAIRDTKKKYPKFVLVDVESSSGEKVSITL